MPYLLLSDDTTVSEVSQLLGFSMPKRDGSGGTEKIDISMKGIALTAPTGMKFSDVIVLVTADGESHNITDVTVGDLDGDATIVANTSVTGEMRATWFDANIPITNLNQTLSVCGGPYTLKIELPTAVSANTTYGYPRTNLYGTHDSVTYTFTSTKQAICYLKPGSMTVNTTGVSIPEGYNKSEFNVNNGFKVGSGFPTTGFEKAVFSVIGPGTDQSSYLCSSTDDGGKITLSGSASTSLGEKCKVTYNSATKADFTAGGTPTLTMKYNNGSSWVTIDSYTIPIPTKWAIGKGKLMYGNLGSLSTSTNFAVLNACRLVVDGSATPVTTQAQALDMTDSGKAWRQKYLYRRDELTNSVYVNNLTYPEGESPLLSDNSFSRTVDGTFMGEWGYVYTYAGSGWNSNPFYWTAEAWSTGNQFHILSGGRVSNSAPNNSNLVAICRGEL